MYMFFWFFKQFYYCLRRIFKKGLLILFLFFIIFIFWFINKGAFAFSINNTTYPDFPTEYQGKNFYMFTLTGSNNGFSAGTYAFILNGSIYNFGTDEEPKLMQVSSANYIHGWLTSARYETARFDVLTLNNNQWTLNRSAWGGGIGNFNTFQYIGGTMDIYNYAWTQKLYEKNYSLFTDPYIVTDEEDIINWSFDNLLINGGSYPTEGNYWLRYTYPNINNSYTLDLSAYSTIENNTIVFSIPKSILQESIVIRNGSSFTFGLQYRYNSQVLYQDFGSYTLNITEQTQTETNEDSNKQVLSDISNNQKETTQAIENLENTITDTNVDFNDIELPSDNSDDITSNGVNNIFTSFYNAFCSGEPQNIVFPIPYTNKSITIEPNYLRDMLNNNGASWVISFIEAFWWYIISRYIIKDILDKINKIKSGNIEKIENSNIKGDML